MFVMIDTLGIKNNDIIFIIKWYFLECIVIISKVVLFANTLVLHIGSLTMEKHTHCLILTNYVFEIPFFYCQMLVNERYPRDTNNSESSF